MATRQAEADRQREEATMKNHGDKSAATLATGNLSLRWGKSGKTPKYCANVKMASSMLKMKKLMPARGVCLIGGE